MRTIVALALLCLAPLVAQEAVDLSVVHRIRTEAFEHSKVMEHLSYISDAYGPRLTGSPEFKQAADWAAKRLQDYGLENSHLEKWGPFGRSWSLRQFSVEMIEPRYSLLVAWPLAWTHGTNGPVTGEAVYAPLKNNPDLAAAEEATKKYMETWHGKLRGKVVLLSEMQRDVTKAESSPKLNRYTEAQLGDLAKAPVPAELPEVDLKNLKIPEQQEERVAFFSNTPFPVLMKVFEKSIADSARVNKFIEDEGAIAILKTDGRAHESLVFAEQAGGHEMKDPLALPIFVVTAEQYNRMTRLAGKKIPVRLNLNLKVDSPDAAVDGQNIIAEIPGGSKKDEVVMLGAHFDSWHSGTGATDNGAGSAVMMEVVRILKSLDLKLDRTVRIALWSGEEQGLLGSMAYVKEHFGDLATMQVTAQHTKLSAYFNLDNGSGKIRGVYLQGNNAMRPVFEQWLAPFRDLDVSTVTIRNTGGTDHLSFDLVGLPAFQFIQDSLDYGTETHHSNMDVYDHAQPGDLMQAAAVIASCVYDAANRSEKLPRKPLPKALPEVHLSTQ